MEGTRKGLTGSADSWHGSTKPWVGFGRMTAKVSGHPSASVSEGAEGKKEGAGKASPGERIMSNGDLELEDA